MPSDTAKFSTPTPTPESELRANSDRRPKRTLTLPPGSLKARHETGYRTPPLGSGGYNRVPPLGSGGYDRTPPLGSGGYCIPPLHRLAAVATWLRSMRLGRPLPDCNLLRRAG